ncbi:MAG: hypothetical protein RHS_0669 [Robinsoniella sp. RHS]|nr:MAG: hypothetical protein RHS_0669 [Robinsoniella sp. RHS]
MDVHNNDKWVDVLYHYYAIKDNVKKVLLFCSSNIKSRGFRGMGYC